jgi:hypothetical protein
MLVKNRHFTNNRVVGEVACLQQLPFVAQQAPRLHLLSKLRLITMLSLVAHIILIYVQ